MLVKTSELIGAALDWAVAQCEGVVDYPNLKNGDWGWTSYAPSRKWEQGGPIVERHIFRLEDGDGVEAWPDRWVAEGGGSVQYGPTALIAAMRAYVESKLGREVEIPEGL